MDLKNLNYFLDMVLKNLNCYPGMNNLAFNHTFSFNDSNSKDMVPNLDINYVIGINHMDSYYSNQDLIVYVHMGFDYFDLDTLLIYIHMICI